MPNEQKYMILHTWNSYLIKLHGEKLKGVQWFINIKSKGLHTAIQFSDRHGGISTTATMMGGFNCDQFIDSKYTHPYRQSRVYIPCTDYQEDLVFRKSCEMANVPSTDLWSHLVQEPNQIISEGYTSWVSNYSRCYFGPNAIPYDTLGVSLSFISRCKIWNPSPKKNWCNESCAIKLLAAWPDLLTVLKGTDREKTYKPHDLNPIQFESLVRNYFDEGVE